MGTASSMASFGLQAWVDASLDGDGRVQLSGDSDSALTRGLVAVLLHSLSGLTPEEVLAVEPASLAGLVSAAFLLLSSGCGAVVCCAIML
jgi:cysteine desulfuration protein SufE